MELFLWLLLLLGFIALLYTPIKYLASPKRKFNKAHKDGTFYFLDNSANIRENFFITYKGMMFQGEKYTDNQTKSSGVRSIFIWSEHTSTTEDMNEEDMRYIERAIHSNYPTASIDWKSTKAE